MPGARHRDGDSRLRRLPHGARSYAAAPEEHRFEPRLVSTLFPHLTAADMVVFRLALGVGAAVLVALALARLYPLALVVSAVLVPLLGLLSFWYVDVYEDEPVRVLLFTVAWGVGTGVGFAFLTDAVQAPHAELLSRTTAHSVVWNGVLLPVIGLALVLIGPLVLLPYRKFNDTLDGATFGGVAAITFVGASLFTHSSSFLSAGFEPVGQSTPWLLRLLTLGLVVPVIALTAVGAATGSLWLRYRAPARDRRALGVLGHPVPALIVAACALVGSALLQLYLSRWIALAALAALSVPLVLWLRQVVHVGLTEEAAERPARASRTCLNCGHAAGGGAFCSNCGVALAALPKQSRGHGPAVVLAAGGLLVAAIAVAVLLAVRPAPARPFCAGKRHCGGPPVASVALSTAPPLVDGRIWRSSRGVRLEYDPALWTASAAGDGSSIFLTSSGRIGGLDMRLFVDAEPAGASSSAARIGAERDYLVGLYPSLALDGPDEQPLTPSIGSAFGVGEADAGTTADERNPVEAMLLDAQKDGVDVLVAAWTDNPHGLGGDAPYPAFLVVDQLLETFTWPSEAGP